MDISRINDMKCPNCGGHEFKVCVSGTELNSISVLMEYNTVTAIYEVLDEDVEERLDCTYNDPDLNEEYECSRCQKLFGEDELVPIDGDEDEGEGEEDEEDGTPRLRVPKQLAEITSPSVWRELFDEMWENAYFYHKITHEQALERANRQLENIEEAILKLYKYDKPVSFSVEVENGNLQLTDTWKAQSEKRHYKNTMADDSLDAVIDTLRTLDQKLRRLPHVKYVKEGMVRFQDGSFIDIVPSTSYGNSAVYETCERCMSPKYGVIRAETAHRENWPLMEEDSHMLRFLDMPVYVYLWVPNR